MNIRLPTMIYRYLVLGFVLAGFGLLFWRPVPAHAGSGVVTVRLQSVRTELTAYGRVVPLALLRVKAPTGGRVTGLHLRPGAAVKAGEPLARLEGPAVAAKLSELEAAAAGARAQLAAYQKILAAERRKVTARLATRSAVLRAEADVAGVKAQLAAARARLRAARAATRLTAPVPGTVLDINAPSGQMVQAGEPILTIRPTGALWLLARYYPSENEPAVRLGMKGNFQPAGGESVIPVKVGALLDRTAKDGGREIGLVATITTPRWHQGDAGEVHLAGGTRQLAAVPTRALILDRGKWWVMVRQRDVDRSRQVVPAESCGTWTMISKGLKAGEAVVVENAYLEFHRKFSKQYQQPD